MSAQINIATQCVEVVIYNAENRYVDTMYRNTLKEAINLVEAMHIVIVDVETLPF